jgi:predicted alpha/beta-fold hydrolase
MKMGINIINKLISPIKQRAKPIINKKKVKFNKSKFFTYTAISLLGYIGYRQYFPYGKYKIYYSEDNPLNAFVVNKLLPIDYRETMYLSGCLLQMAFNETKSAPHIHYEREYINMKDGGCIALDWYQKNPSKHVDKLLVIMHGLTGGSESTYVREIVDEFSKKEDMRIVVINYRGIADSPLLTPLIYHVGFTEDLFSAMQHIRKSYPKAKCYALGVSMGANLFAKMLSQHRDFDTYIKGFMSISNPLNCHEVEKRNRGFIIDYLMLKRQINYVKKHHHMLVSYVGKCHLTVDNITILDKLKYYRDFDELIIVKMFKFDSVDDYYIKSSCVHDLHNIRVPSLFINAADDLISPIECVDKNICK